MFSSRLIIRAVRPSPTLFSKPSTAWRSNVFPSRSLHTDLRSNPWKTTQMRFNHASRSVWTTPVATRPFTRALSTPAQQTAAFDPRITGPERDQLLHPSEMPSILHGDFGTLQTPVIVPSYNASRIVGCVGGPHLEHELLWHLVSEDKPTICLECGQVFKLKRWPVPAHLAIHEEDHGHGDHGDHGHGHEHGHGKGH